MALDSRCKGVCPCFSARRADPRRLPTRGARRAPSAARPAHRRAQRRGGEVTRHRMTPCKPKPEVMGWGAPLGVGMVGGRRNHGWPRAFAREWARE